MIKRVVIIIFLVISLVFTTSCFTFIDDNQGVGNAIVPLLKDTKPIVNEYTKNLQISSNAQIEGNLKKRTISKETEYYVKYGGIQLNYIGNLDPWPTKTSQPYWKLKMWGLVNSEQADLKTFYLQEGPQTKLTDIVQSNANANGNGATTRERISNLIAWEQHVFNSDCTDQTKRELGYNFQTNTYPDEIKRTRTAEQIILSKCATGCTDYTLVFAALARANGIPATVTETISEKWVAEMVWNNIWNNNKQGHFFSEVFLPDEQKWIVIDPTANIVYDKKDSKGYFIGPDPEGRIRYQRDENGVSGIRYLLFERGLDSWDYGINTMEQFGETVKKRYYVERGDQP